MTVLVFIHFHLAMELKDLCFDYEINLYDCIIKICGICVCIGIIYGAIFWR